MTERSHGYTFPDPDSDIYVGWLDGKPERIDRLKPLQTPLSFHHHFINEVATNDEIEEMAMYTNGWEL